MANFEKPYRDKLIELVLDKFKLFKRKPNSMLILGTCPGAWQFGKECADRSEMDNVMFYSADEGEVKQAGESGMNTSAIEPSNLEQITSGKRYDVIVAKGTVECVAHKVPSLDELLITLYKSSTLRGMIVLIVRLEPTFPMPSSASELWRSRVPTTDQLRLAIDDTGLGLVYDIEPVAFDAQCTNAQYTDDLLAMPHLSECGGDKIGEFVKTLGDPVVFKDTVHVIRMSKKIERVQRDDKGIVQEQNGNGATQ